VMGDEHAGAVSIGEAQRGGPQAVSDVVGEMIEPGGGLVSAVDFGRQERVELSHGRGLDQAVLAAGTGVDDAGARRMLADCLEKGQVAAQVHIEVVEGVVKAVEVKTAAGEVEDE